jgi:CheY-like chemotaxis protein
MRILCLEDTEDELKEIVALLRITFPGVDLETATTGKEARETLDRARQTGKRFDVAVLDMKVPADADMPAELDLALCVRVREAFPEIVLIHYTIHADEEAVRAHGERYLGYDKIVDKIRDGSRVLIEAIRQGYSDKLLDRTRALLGAAFKRSTAGVASMRCGTLEVNALIQDIANDFGLLDSQRQAEIQNYVTVEEDKVEGRFRVTLGPGRSERE